MDNKIYYEIAGIVLEVNLPKGIVIEPMEPYCIYRVEKKTPDIFLNYSFVKQLKLPERLPIYKKDQEKIYESEEEVIRFVHRCSPILKEIDGTVKLEKETGDFMNRYKKDVPNQYEIFLLEHQTLNEKKIFYSIGLEHLLATQRAVILHSAYIDYKGKAILFSAPSGTGKSTQAELWRMNREGTEVVNGDRSILTCRDGIPEANGLPFCGTSKIYKKKTLPIRAIVILRQGKQNVIHRLQPLEAVQWLLSECNVMFRIRQDVENTMDLLTELVQIIPVFWFSCLPDVSAVSVLEQALIDYEQEFESKEKK